MSPWSIGDRSLPLVSTGVRRMVGTPAACPELDGVKTEIQNLEQGLRQPVL